MTSSGFKIRIFSVLEERLGTNVLTLTESGPLTVAELLDSACRAYPELGTYRAFFRIAVNLEYVNDDYTIRPGDEVAILMPASGG